MDKMLRFTFGAVVTAVLFAATAGYAQQRRYPYVTANGEGKNTVIVCREGDAGVLRKFIHDNWTTTPAHDHSNVSYSGFAAKFEVATVDSEAGVCVSGWRIPTVRELRLIYALRDELTDAKISGEPVYRSATTVKGSSTDGWCVHFSTGSTETFELSRQCSVRCVRDL